MNFEVWRGKLKSWDHFIPNYILYYIIKNIVKAMNLQNSERFIIASFIFPSPSTHQTSLQDNQKSLKTLLCNFPLFWARRVIIACDVISLFISAHSMLVPSHKYPWEMAVWSHRMRHVVNNDDVMVIYRITICFMLRAHDEEWLYLLCWR